MGTSSEQRADRNIRKIRGAEDRCSTPVPFSTRSPRWRKPSAFVLLHRTGSHTISPMARGTRKIFKGAVPLTFFAIPVAGGALAYGLPPSCSLRGVTGRMPAFQGWCRHRLREDGSPSDACYSRRTLRRARSGQVGAAVQVIFNI